ncbi:unnamed protein product, partial [Rotaria magnacalcarata]
KYSKVSAAHRSIERRLNYDGGDDDDDDAIILNLTSEENHISIHVADPLAFNNSFVQQRQQAIDNRSYQSAIESCQPTSLQ